MATSVPNKVFINPTTSVHICLKWVANITIPSIANPTGPNSIGSINIQCCLIQFIAPPIIPVMKLKAVAKAAPIVLSTSPTSPIALVTSFQWVTSNVIPPINKGITTVAIAINGFAAPASFNPLCATVASSVATVWESVATVCCIKPAFCLSRSRFICLTVNCHLLVSIAAALWSLVTPDILPLR